MIYLIEGEEQIFVENKINELCKNSDAEIVKFDGSSKDFTLNKLLSSCIGNTLFSQKSIILVKDAPFLLKKYEDKELEALYSYIDNPIYETDLIFYTLENKHNGKLKAYKTITKNARVFELNSYDYKNFNTYVNQLINFNNLDISNDGVYLLNTICKRNATLLNKNIEILKNYPDKITKEIVEKLCTASDDNDAFDLINAMTNKNITRAISIERKMLNNNDNIISLIGLLASQLRFLYQLSYYLSIGKNRNEIIEITKCSEGRYNKSMETLNKLKLNEIIKLLKDLSDLDILCKSDNSISDVSRFEMYILNLLG